MEKLYVVVYDENEWPMEPLYFATNNKEDSRVLKISGPDLDILKNGETLKIINNINKSNIIPDDDWIPMNEAKIACYNKLLDYHDNNRELKEIALIKKIIDLFRISIGTSNAVCFYYSKT